jgi:hypothetical protein
LPAFTTLFADAITADTAYLGQFTGGQKFYLRVRGVNDLGATGYSAVDTFTIMSPPARPTLLAPANNLQNVVSDSVIFVWSKVSSAVSYNLQLSTVNSTTTYPGITDTTYMVRSLAKLTNYTWKIEAINPGGTSYYTGAFAFTSVIAAPAVPSALLPASAATSVNRLTRFTWNATLNATKYRLQVATDNAFTAVVRDTVVFDTTATLIRPLDAAADYYWRLNAQNIGGASAFSTARLFSTGLVLDVEEELAEVPQVYALLQNYPNPFNPSTRIEYGVPQSSHVTLEVYNVLGEKVATLVDGEQEAGYHQVVFDAKRFASGMYFYRLVTENTALLRKMLLVK